jgi:hypothetical protein
MRPAHSPHICGVRECFGVWRELKGQIDVEEAQLQHLLELHRPLLEKCRSEEPGPIELSMISRHLSLPSKMAYNHR